MIYRTPTSSPPKQFNVFVTNPAVDPREAVQEAANDAGFSVVRRGYDQPIEIRYAGPAVEYVDCGVWLASTGASYPAATPVLDYRLRNDPDVFIRRAMVLEISGVLEEQGRGTNVRRVSLNASYTVTRTLETFDREGETKTQTDSVAFAVEERGVFPDGAFCQASGVLERSFLSRL